MNNFKWPYWALILHLKINPNPSIKSPPLSLSVITERQFFNYWLFHSSTIHGQKGAIHTVILRCIKSLHLISWWQNSGALVPSELEGLLLSCAHSPGPPDVSSQLHYLFKRAVGEEKCRVGSRDHKVREPLIRIMSVGGVAGGEGRRRTARPRTPRSVTDATDAAKKCVS